jgi:uncharacterized protein (DUF4415 family)
LKKDRHLPPSLARSPAPVTIRVGTDVLAWLKRQGRGYQTRINKLLREAMERKRRRA